MTPVKVMTVETLCDAVEEEEVSFYQYMDILMGVGVETGKLYFIFPESGIPCPDHLLAVIYTDQVEFAETLPLEWKTREKRADLIMDRSAWESA